MAALASLIALIPALMIHSFEVVAALIALDTLLGIFGALAKGKWNWSYLSHFLETSILPIIGSLLTLAALSFVQNSFLALFYAAAATATAKLLADIIAKINSWGVVAIPTNEPIAWKPPDTATGTPGGTTQATASASGADTPPAS